MSRAFRALGKTLKWLLILGALFVVGVTIAVIVSLGSASDKSEKSSDQVSPAEYRSLHNGDSRAAIRQLLGSPENTDVTEVGGLGKSACWYYGTLAQKTYQLCFENGKLAYKSRY